MFLQWNGVISQKSTEDLEVVSNEGKGVSKETQYYTELSILRGQRKQGMCFEVVEVSGIRGVRDKWSRCSKHLGSWVSRTNIGAFIGVFIGVAQ